MNYEVWDMTLHVYYIQVKLTRASPLCWTLQIHN